MLKIKLFVAVKLWRNDNNGVLIIAMMLKWSLYAELQSFFNYVRFYSIETAKAQGKYVYQARKPLKSKFGPNPNPTRKAWPDLQLWMESQNEPKVFSLILFVL